jgi:hypothetical protein
MDWHHGPIGHRDPVLRAMLADVGGDAILGGQVEGSFFAADLFREMLEVMERHWRPGEGEPYAREEIFYPTLAAHLATGPIINPLLFADTPAARQSVSPTLIAGLIDGSYAEDPARPDRGTGRTRMYDFDHLYAVKRVDRTLHDPNRTFIRALGRATGRRLRIDPPFEAGDFVGLAFGTDVVSDLALIPSWLSEFAAEDDATLAILVDPADAGHVDAVVAAAAIGGSEAPGAGDLALVAAPAGSFAEATLRWAINVLWRTDGAETPAWLDAVPLFGPASRGHLPLMAAAATRTRA